MELYQAELSYCLIYLLNYEQLGYKICSISSEPLAELFGIDNFPNFMFDKISLEEKTDI